MEENNIHTSVVIELANQGEPEEQKSYQIEIDDVNLPKDYVIDQIYCGENVTVYALFEVPENENKHLENNLIKVSDSNIDNDNKFYFKNSFKKVMNEKKSIGYKENLSRMASEENSKFFSDQNNRNDSFYCLKHPNKNQDLLSSEKKKSDLKVLYSKDFSSENSKSTKFKAISVGVNTDIVQSPRIIEEVQKVLGVTVPLLKFKEKTGEATNPSSMPSYDLADMETRPSFSSLASSAGSKNCIRKSISNFFFVPLLMMGDEILSKFPKEDSIQNSLEEEKLPNLKSFASKVSLGVNTDLAGFISRTDLNEEDKKETQDIEHFESIESSNIQKTDANLVERLKLNEKKTILKEIKTMQLKLNSLIKTIESNESDRNAKDEEFNKSKQTTDGFESREKFLQDLELFERNPKNLDDRPIFLPWAYPVDYKKSKASLKSRLQDTKGNEKNEVSTNLIDAVFDEVTLKERSPVLKIDRNKSEPKFKKTVSAGSVSLRNLENLKSSGLSKSETTLSFNVKCNSGIKKSLSLDLRNVKMEVFKNLKNCSFKLEGSLKKYIKMKILQNNEVNAGDNQSFMKCESGADVNKKMNLLNSSQENEKKVHLNFSDNISSDAEKSYNEEEGDAKLLKPKGSLLTATFAKIAEKQHLAHFDANVTASDGLLSPKKSICSCKKESVHLDKMAEPEKKTCSDSEKPPTPNGNFRKIITTNSNMKKDLKVTKKSNNRFKVAEMSTKIELPSKKTITSNRKSARNSAESKLHINKLIKTDVLNNHKTPQTLKICNDEKAGAKGDRNHRPTSQKHEIRESPVEVLSGANKEMEIKLLKKKSGSSVHTDSSLKKNIGFNLKANAESVSGFENTEKLSSHLTLQKPNLVSSNPSSVVVELLSKKPTSIKDLYSKISRERVDSGKVPGEAFGINNDGTFRKSRTHLEADENLENMEKSIVKSVWALTKVLLYEDGTKKLEVLEASLTPPGYSLNQSVKTPK